MDWSNVWFFSDSSENIWNIWDTLACAKTLEEVIAVHQDLLDCITLRIPNYGRAHVDRCHQKPFYTLHAPTSKSLPKNLDTIRLWDDRFKLEMKGTIEDIRGNCKLILSYLWDDSMKKAA